jgi:hypothetical protein
MSQPSPRVMSHVMQKIIEQQATVKDSEGADPGEYSRSKVMEILAKMFAFAEARKDAKFQFYASIEEVKA